MVAAPKNVTRPLYFSNSKQMECNLTKRRLVQQNKEKLIILIFFQLTYLDPPPSILHCKTFCLRTIAKAILQSLKCPE